MNPHLQTLAARLARSLERVDYERIRLATPDGDFLDLDLYREPAAAGPDAPTALLLHGLEGSSRSGYVVSAAQRLAARGFRTVALNFRSRSGELNRRPGSYHAGRTDDVGLVVEHLRKRLPAAPLAAVGFSLGGNVLLKYLGELGEAGPGRITAAAAISVPFDLSRCADRMERGLGSAYALRFLVSLRRTARRKARRFPGAYDLEAIARARTMREFDEALTAPVHGFRSAEHYYAECSSGPYLARIRVPTLLVQARDDPLVPAETIPEETIRRSPWLFGALTGRGGHVGFLSVDGTGNAPWRVRLWAEEEVARFLESAVGADGRGGRRRDRSGRGAPAARGPGQERTGDLEAAGVYERPRRNRRAESASPPEDHPRRETP